MNNLNNSSSKFSCKICNHKSFNQENDFKILKKFKTNLLICENCGFQQFSDFASWIDLAYSDAIASTDTGIVKRCILNSEFISSYLTLNKKNHIILDWGTGSGLFVRLMRDKGWNAFGYEPIADPLLSSGFTYKSISKIKNKSSYKLITAFEVLEHIDDPLNFLEKVFSLSDTLIFSTVLAKEKFNKKWWYYSPETGQHISFYTNESFKYIGKIFNCYFASSRNNYHILTKNKRNFLIFKLVMGHNRNKLISPLIKLLNKFIFKKRSLIVDDFEEMRKRIYNK